MAGRNILSKAYTAFLYKMGERYADNIFNVIMNTVQFLEYELALSAGNEADVLIHPEVYEAHWAQFYEPEKFIKAGEEEAKEHLAEIKQLLAE
jgi:NTE family protein